MNHKVQKIVLTEQESQPESTMLASNYLGLVGGINVQCSVRIGTLNLSINELRQLKTGQVLKLDQKTNDPIELLLNGQVIARGELMSCEDKFAIHITEVIA